MIQAYSSYHCNVRGVWINEQVSDIILYGFTSLCFSLVDLKVYGKGGGENLDFPWPK